jgi:hypothetical protein
MIIVDHNDLSKYTDVICDPEQPIAERVDALFCIRSFPQIEAIDALI